MVGHLRRAATLLDLLLQVVGDLFQALDLLLQVRHEVLHALTAQADHFLFHCRSSCSLEVGLALGLGGLARELVLLLKRCHVYLTHWLLRIGSILSSGVGCSLVLGGRCG